MEPWSIKVLLAIVFISGTLTITTAQRNELVTTVQTAERMVQEAVSSTKHETVKGRRVYVFSDFISKKQLYDYYAQMWSASLATQLAHETSDFNHSIPGRGLAIHPYFHQISILTMKKPEVRVISYLKNTAIVECLGQVEGGERYRIEYRLTKKADSSRWLVAHKVVTPER
jgi:hypothetical protein